MQYRTKSLVISRRKVSALDDLPYVVDIKFFGINNPHLTTQLPQQEVEFSGIECVQIRGFLVEYFVRGSDLVINNVGIVEIHKDDTIVHVKSV
ncbi:MAG: hypothetical protein AABX52_01225 [Nanoarchaeota archaeon]